MALPSRGSPCPARRDDLGKAVGQKMVLVGAFLGDEALDYDAKPISVPAALGLDEIEE